MTAHVPVQSLLTGDDGVGFVAVPNAERPRWLLPRDRRLRAAALTLYAPQRWGGRIRKQVVRAGLHHAVAHVRGDVVSWLRVVFERATKQKDVGLAFALGAPGAYRKITVLGFSADMRPLGVLKLPATDLAPRAIAAEHAALTYLAGRVGLRGRIPSVLLLESFDDVPCLVMSSGPLRPGPRRLGKPHLRFLSSLQRETEAVKPFEESALWRDAGAVHDQLESHLPRASKQRYAQALDRIGERLVGVSLPLSFAHRDFTPWNTTTGERGLFVFDWENGRRDYPPLVDAIHFHAIPKALMTPHESIVEDPRWVESLAGRVCPEVTSAAGDLLVAYLLDQALYYTRARLEAPREGEDRVLVWIDEQLDRAMGRPR